MLSRRLFVDVLKYGAQIVLNFSSYLKSNGPITELAQLEERSAFNRVVVGSSPIFGDFVFFWVSPSKRHCHFATCVSRREIDSINEK